MPGHLCFHSWTVFGQVPAFLLWLTLFFVITSGTAAALAAAFSDNLRQIVPMPAVAGKIIAIAFIGLVALINVCGTRFSANIQNVLAVIKIGSVLHDQPCPSLEHARYR